MIVSTGGITWASAHNFFFILPLILLAIGMLIRRFLWQKSRARMLAAPHHAQRLLRHFSLSKTRIKTGLLGGALIFLALALARPSWENLEETVEQHGRDVLIALDISRSMLAADVHPSRLEYAKNKIKELVQALSAERVGLIVFSGAPFLQCPLTADISGFLTFLESTDAETISGGTTALDQAVQKALDVFSRMATKKHKLLVIFTDGEDFSSQLEGIKQKAQAVGLHIFTVGIGTPEGAPIPLIDEQGTPQGHQKDEQGRIVISRLNERLLQKLSQDSGAFYVRGAPDDKDIVALLKRIQSFEKEKFEDKRIAAKKEKYYYFGGCALLCLLLEWIL